MFKGQEIKVQAANIDYLQIDYLLFPLLIHSITHPIAIGSLIYLFLIHAFMHCGIQAFFAFPTNSRTRLISTGFSQLP